MGTLKGFRAEPGFFPDLEPAPKVFSTKKTKLHGRKKGFGRACFRV